MATIKAGGQTDSLARDKKIKEIKFSNETASPDRIIYMMVNDSSLTYLELDEAIALRDELNKALHCAVFKVSV